MERDNGSLVRKLTFYNGGSPTTGIPMEIARALGIAPGDCLRWTLIHDSRTRAVRVEFLSSRPFDKAGRLVPASLRAAPVPEQG